MPKIEYIAKKFKPATLDIISKANEILAEFAARGINMTLRMLYYRFIARDLFPENWIDPTTGSKNVQKNYKRLGDAVNDGRLAGVIDWSYLEDRTREIRGVGTEHEPYWRGPAHIIRAAMQTFRLDKWTDQDTRIELWVEKDAAVGVVEGICHELEIPYFSCRGYVSQSEMWVAGQRLLKYSQGGQDITILHIGDHDPSGVQMTEDIAKRLAMFTGDRSGIEVKRIALNMDQVELYNPPPNPAKETDARFKSYEAEYGDECYELDALDPTVTVDLIREAVLETRDEDRWTARLEEEEHARHALTQTHEHWHEVVEYLEREYPEGNDDA